MKYLVIFFLVMCSGCQSAKPALKQTPMDEAISAVGTMTQGLTNQDVSQEDLKRLSVQVQKDPDTRSAVEAVNSAFSIQDTCIKYCPVDGKRFSCRLDVCPDHQVKLLPVE